jgi:hypothetical protein
VGGLLWGASTLLIICEQWEGDEREKREKREREREREREVQEEVVVKRCGSGAWCACCTMSVPALCLDRRPDDRKEGEMVWGRERDQWGLIEPLLRE